jgi:hypothetical protein
MSMAMYEKLLGSSDPVCPGIVLRIQFAVQQKGETSAFARVEHYSYPLTRGVFNATSKNSQRFSRSDHLQTTGMTLGIFLNVLVLEEVWFRQLLVKV